MIIFRQRNAQDRRQSVGIAERYVIEACKIRSEANLYRTVDRGRWSRKMRWKRRRGRLMTFHARARAAIREKKFTVARRAFLLRGAVVVVVGWRIEFYFRSGESGSPLALPAAEEHQLIRRFSYSYSALPITPLRPVVSTKHLVSVEASLRLETRRVSFLSSFPYWFTDQASKRYDPFLLFSPSLFLLLFLLSAYIYVRVYSILFLLPLLVAFLPSFLSFFIPGSLSCLFPSFVFVYEHNRLCIKRANRNKALLFITLL